MVPHATRALLVDQYASYPERLSGEYGTDMSQESASASVTPEGTTPDQPLNSLPDIARDGAVSFHGALDRVGMSGIELPVRVDGPQGPMLIPAHVSAMVSLDQPKAKGIHMSRLFLALQQRVEQAPLTPQLLQDLLCEFIASHEGLSTVSSLKISYELPMLRPSLKSDNTGWRQYPVSLAGILRNGHLEFSASVRVTYSSTCPCSAALARQLIQERFKENFTITEGASPEDILASMHEWLGREESICATPHSQRSHADVEVVSETADGLPTFITLIDEVERVLATAVQSVVKREDEQEFARLNAANLMFCEDAARRVKSLLESMPGVADYRARMAHMESLHPHDAVSIITKGIPGGLMPGCD